ncbi:hypothetical protein Ahy_B04g072766 isoform J [Arachis hypogaea]|uniref:Uncharacterized protein n=1 Tax=Arachis hypogaea TaxID=3818 RepID=A0A444ZNY2_ARAHY|nr:hypothetical protein Ahy_B04g072766 isoform J [Arachis hypogaea]
MPPKAQTPLSLTPLSQSQSSLSSSIEASRRRAAAHAPSQFVSLQSFSAPWCFVALSAVVLRRSSSAFQSCNVQPLRLHLANFLYDNKEVGEEFNPDPSIATVMNCAFWGVLRASFCALSRPHSILVLTINCVGC